MTTSRLFRLASTALVVVCVAAPGSAAVSTTRSLPAGTAANKPTSSARALYRQARLGARGSITVTGAPGCSSDGYASFVGGGYENYAGGQSRGNGGEYSGVIDGYQNESCDWYTAIGGGYQNTVGGDGSSNNSFIGAGNSNAIEAYGSFVGSGYNNTVGKIGPYDDSYSSSIVSGDSNTVASYASFIGAGDDNTIVGTNYSFVGAGYSNSISGNYSTIGAGENNSVTADSSTIAGGIQNSISGTYSTIAGGYNNVVSGVQAVVAGGYGNVASAKDTAIPGGSSNIASGSNSFAAGTRADAATPGTFVWADDSSSSLLTSTVPNEFLARASGGFALYSSATLKSGVRLAPGSGSWSSLSDRAAKTAVTTVDDARILAKVASLPVSEWSYIEQGSGVRHLGPMAQDFHAAFGLGEDDRHISAVDEEGVALAAIKALQAEVAVKDEQLTNLESRVEALEKANAIERPGSQLQL